MRNTIIILLCVVIALLTTKLIHQQSELKSLKSSYSNEIIDYQGFFLIWNDVPESLPEAGSKVIIEEIDGNTIYLGNY